MTGPLYILFFFSGLSGLIYQVVWVRVFGNVFGNTIYSTSLVVAVFMLGLGVGSYVVGAWSDRRYAARPESLLRAYGHFELIIAVMGLGISALLPHLDRISALVSSYLRDAAGWYVLSTSSYLARAAIAVLLLTPITLLMGGTLTLLVRHLVRNDLEIGGWRIAVLYGVNTAGAALGCFLTDFMLVQRFGVLGTQIVAVVFNAIAGVGALLMARSMNVRLKADATTEKASRQPKKSRRGVRLQADVISPQPVKSDVASGFSRTSRASTVPLTALALALSGFGAMGMEILWFRHFTILLGGFRAVFSLLLTVILIGIGAGSLISGFLLRRAPKPSAEAARPAQWLMVVQGLFVAVALLGLTTADSRKLEAAVRADPAYQIATGQAVDANLVSGFSRASTELWFNARPILLEVGLAALLMGFGFPLANAIIQHAERSVGRRAGALYFSNTIGAVSGSLAAGFLLLPRLGLQASATTLTAVAALAIVPLYSTSRVGRTLLGPPSWNAGPDKARPTYAVVVAMLIAGSALAWWSVLPSDYVITRALGSEVDDARVIAQREGVIEIITVKEQPAKGRTLLTNGHPMSSTAPLSQRYMRALAHIPLLSMDNPEAVLVIGFGVGNTTHAATLHSSIRRVEVADLSRDILAHAGYFNDANRNVLGDPRVAVYVNDGRHHLQMRPPASYDLITLEPPPIGYAGVVALYSREFYALARGRLKPKGYLSQWLPAYQAPTATTLAMIRAFVDVFPQAVLLSGAEADLLLLGTTDPRIEIDPARLTAVLSKEQAVKADLQQLDLGTVREIVGTFVGSAETLAEATRQSPPVTDDRPIQEYGVQSLLNFGEAVPGSVVNLSKIVAWCPRCFVKGEPAPLVEGLDTYLALLKLAYAASPIDIIRARKAAESGPRLVAGSAYLGAFVPESEDVHNLLGISLARQGRIREAIAEFREALVLEPDSAATHWHLGAALASSGAVAARDEAIEHLRRAVQLDPGNTEAYNDLRALTGVAGRP